MRNNINQQFDQIQFLFYVWERFNYDLDLRRDKNFYLQKLQLFSEVTIILLSVATEII